MTRLLVVDDDAHVRRLLALYLRSVGEVSEAANDEEALRLADEVRPTIVFVDLVLPNSGGFRIAQKLKERTAPPFVVLMTGDDSDDTRYHAKEAGADAFLAKPFSAAQVEEIVARAVAA